jgi:hypothetical protein
MTTPPHLPISKSPHRWYWVGAALGVLILGTWWFTVARPAIHLDLVDHLPNAAQQRPTPETFRVVDVSIAGETKRSIYVTEQSRLIFEETLPKGAWLRVSLGVREEAWDREGAGVLFMVGVSHDGRYQELVSLIVNPAANPADRQWLPVLLDLSPWAGEQVELILNTRESYPGAGAANHLAVWGAPAIVTR